MNTFTRYFIHLFLIITALLGIIGILMIMNPEGLAINKIVIVVSVIMAYLYCIFMALYCSNVAAKSVIIKIPYNQYSESDILLSKIDSIIKNKTYRSDIIKDNNGTLIYTHKNRYLKWLTNTIRITLDKDEVIINCPQEYIKYFKGIKE